MHQERRHDQQALEIQALRLAYNPPDLPLRRLLRPSGGGGRRQPREQRRARVRRVEYLPLHAAAGERKQQGALLEREVRKRRLKFKTLSFGLLALAGTKNLKRKVLGSFRP